MQFLTSLTLCNAIVLSFYCHTPVFAQRDNLPKVGEIKKSVGGAGCTFWLPSSKLKKAIFFDGVAIEKNTIMNLDGRDTNLTRVFDQNSLETVSSIFTVNNIKVQIKTSSIAKAKYNDHPNAKVIITIARNGQSKVIKAVGYCGCH
jgi:hypothetical protein